MRNSNKALALTFGLLWGGAILTVGLVRQLKPRYGSGFASWVSSIYPGYRGGKSLTDVLLGAIYGFVDAAVGVLVFERLYQHLLRLWQPLRQPQKTQ